MAKSEKLECPNCGVEQFVYAVGVEHPGTNEQKYIYVCTECHQFIQGKSDKQGAANGK